MGTYILTDVAEFYAVQDVLSDSIIDTMTFDFATLELVIDDAGDAEFATSQALVASGDSVPFAEITGKPIDVAEITATEIDVDGIAEADGFKVATAFTPATLPSATLNPLMITYATEMAGSGGSFGPVYSNGINWRKVRNGGVIA